jgi:hypothetical protein
MLSEPQTPAPGNKLPKLRPIFAVLLTALVVAGFVGTLLVLGGRSHMSIAASEPVTTATATTMMTTTTDTPIPTLTPNPTLTATPVPPIADIRVTQNQNMRPSCLDNTAPYTVVLFNAGNVAANWHVVVPLFTGSFSAMVSSRSTRSQPLMIPRSAAPYWAVVTPQEGSITPGQTASFVMNPQTAMPCGGASEHASVQLSFPSGASQAAIPLTYMGTGSVPHSNVVLVSGSQTITEPCPTGGATPAPFIFALKNTGNGTAYLSIDNTKENIGINPWASVAVTYNPSNLPVPTWLYAGETWTVTIAPSHLVQCGMSYHIYVYINNTQGDSSTMTFTDTFQ